MKRHPSNHSTQIQDLWQLFVQHLLKHYWWQLPLNYVKEPFPFFGDALLAPSIEYVCILIPIHY